MAEPNDQDRLDADRFLTRYGEEPRVWERADLVALIAELRERYSPVAPARPEASTLPKRWCAKCPHLLVMHKDGFCKICECGGYDAPSEPAGNTGHSAHLPTIDKQST